MSICDLKAAGKTSLNKKTHSNVQMIKLNCLGVAASKQVQLEDTLKKTVPYFYCMSYNLTSHQQENKQREEMKGEDQAKKLFMGHTSLFLKLFQTLALNST